MVVGSRAASAGCLLTLPLGTLDHVPVCGDLCPRMIPEAPSPSFHMTSPVRGSSHPPQDEKSHPTAALPRKLPETTAKPIVKSWGVPLTEQFDCYWRVSHAATGMCFAYGSARN